MIFSTVPGPPRDVVATRNGSDIVLKWKAPLEENGKIIQYEVSDHS